ncbi:unnamed protein product, partial [Allacma fusca]
MVLKDPGGTLMGQFRPQPGMSMVFGESRSKSESRQEEKQVMSKKGGTIRLQRSISMRQQHRSAHAMI